MKVPPPSVTLVYVHCVEACYDASAMRFVSSYANHPPHYPHETVVITNGGPHTPSMEALFKPLNPRFFEHDDSGWDIGAYLAIAPNLNCDMMLCLGGNTHFKHAGWLKRLADVWQEHGPGMYGSLSSFELRPHLNTTGFVCPPKELAKYPHKVTDHDGRMEFEWGKGAFWRRMVRNGFPAMLVTWDGVWSLDAWRKPENLYRKGDQSNCLIFFRHSDTYDAVADRDTRTFLQKGPDGVFNNEIQPLREKVDAVSAHPVELKIMANHARQQWTLVFSFFRSLTVAHLERSLYSISQQTARPAKYLLFDNGTDFSADEITSAVRQHFPTTKWQFFFAKHGEPESKRSGWGNNTAIRLSDTETFMLMRADYIYDFRFCERMLEQYDGNPMNYATSWMWGMRYYSQPLDAQDHATVDHAADLEALNWREDPARLLHHSAGARPERASHIDGPTYCTSKHAMGLGGWYDESLKQWGFDQQDLQTRMAKNGVNMKVVPEFLYFHMEHPVEPGERDLEKARRDWEKSPRRLTEIWAEEERLKKGALANPA